MPVTEKGVSDCYESLKIKVLFLFHQKHPDVRPTRLAKGRPGAVLASDVPDTPQNGTISPFIERKQQQQGSQNESHFV